MNHPGVDAEVGNPVRQGAAVQPGEETIALIAHPAAGGSTDPEDIERALEAHGAVVERFGLDPASLQRAGESAAERVVVAGGDGSIGLAADVARRLGVPLAVVPTG